MEFSYIDKARELMNLELPKEEQAAKIREILQSVERYILNVTGPDPLSAYCHEWLKGNTGDGNESPEYSLVEDLIMERSAIMNLLFGLHCSDEEVERLKQMNDHLFNLTKELHHKVADTYRMLLSTQKDDSFIDDINIDGIIHYNCESGQDYVMLEDDGYYGSNFSQMLAVIAATENDKLMEIVSASCSWHPDVHTPEMTDKQLGVEDYLNDGQSWHEGFWDLPKVKDVVFCHAVHDICTHKNYSIPDLLRMNTFWSEVKIEIQNIRETDGSRLWWYDNCTLKEFTDKFLKEAEHRPTGMSLAAFIRRRLSDYFTREWFESKEKLENWPRFTSDEDAVNYLAAVWKELKNVNDRRKEVEDIRQNAKENEKNEGDEC